MQQLRKPSIDHIGYLDSVRGIAALMVMAGHYMGWHYKSTEIAIAGIFINGDSAVSFFFVLSGFVLSYKALVLDHAIDLKNFFVNRLFRLFPGFWVAVLVMAIYWNMPLSEQNLKALFLQNTQDIYEELLLFRTKSRFYIAGWTLGIELLISLLVPFMVLIAKYDKRALLAFMGFVVLIGNTLLPLFHVHFALGVVLAAYYYQISESSFRETKWYRYRWLVLPAGILLFTLSGIHKLSPLGPTLMYLFKYLLIDFYLLSGIGAFILLGALIHSKKAQRFLDIGIWRFFGRLSYGVYLMHWFVVSYIYDHWDKVLQVIPGDKMAFLVMFVVCLAATTILALILHYAVELPFMRYGKRLTRRFKPSVVIK